jgi:hypothetical protein
MRVQANSTQQELDRAYKCIELLIDLKDVLGLTEADISAKIAVLEQLYEPDVIRKAGDRLLHKDRSKSNVIAIVNKKGYRSISPMRVNNTTRAAIKAYSPINARKDRTRISPRPSRSRSPTPDAIVPIQEHQAD